MEMKRLISGPRLRNESMAAMSKTSVRGEGAFVRQGDRTVVRALKCRAEPRRQTSWTSPAGVSLGTDESFARSL